MYTEDNLDDLREYYFDELDKLHAEIKRLTRERDSARISSGLHLEQETGWRDLANERYDKTRELERERDALRAAHEQIKTVCDDNFADACDHKMALKFVWQVANAALDDEQSTRPTNEQLARYHGDVDGDGTL